MKRVLLIGAGGHARVVLDAIRSRGELEVIGLIAEDRNAPPIDDVRVVGTDDDLPALKAAGATHAIVTVGSLKPGTLREKLFEKIAAAGLSAATVIHRDATISPSASVGEGSMIFARAVVNPGARIGRNVIVNTGSIVEHDCEIGDHAHLLPGAVVAGATRVGAHAHIGVGATVVRGLTIGARANVAAGAVVIEDVPEGATVAR